MPNDTKNEAATVEALLTALYEADAVTPRGAKMIREFMAKMMEAKHEQWKKSYADYKDTAACLRMLADWAAPDLYEESTYVRGACEMGADAIEALLTTHSGSPQPLAEMLGGFYTTLLKQDIPRDLAGACILKLLEGDLASWIMSDHNCERGEDE